MTPDEKSKLERMLADAAARETPPDELRRRVLAEALLEPDRAAPPRRLRDLWPLLAAGILFSLILWRVVEFNAFRYTPAAQDPKALVQALGADDITLRDKAAGELLALGERARPALEEAAGSAEGEIRLRARDLLAKLDQRARRAKLERHAGTLGETGVHWIEAAAFDLLGEEEILPAGLKPFSWNGLTFGMVQPESSEIKTLGMTGASIAGPILLCRQRFGLATNQTTAGRTGVGAPPHGLGAWSKEARSLRGYDLFRHWPQLRRQSLVFVTAAKPDALRKGLEVAITHERAEVRAAAVHLLRHYVQTDAVESVLRKLDDVAPPVRSAARDTLRVLVNAPDGTVDETRAWWNGLGVRKQSEVLLEQSKPELVKRPCTCETGQDGK